MKALFKFYELEEDESQIVPGIEVSVSEEIQLSEAETSQCHSMNEAYLALHSKAETLAMQFAHAAGEAFAFHLDGWEDPEDVWRVPCPA